MKDACPFPAQPSTFGLKPLPRVSHPALCVLMSVPANNVPRLHTVAVAAGAPIAATIIQYPRARIV